MRGKDIVCDTTAISRPTNTFGNAVSRPPGARQWRHNIATDEECNLNLCSVYQIAVVCFRLPCDFVNYNKTKELFIDIFLSDS